MFVAVCPWSGCCWLGYLDQEKDADAMATFLRDVVLREVEDIKGSWTPSPEDRSNPDSGEVSMGITEKHGGVFKALERSLVSARARDQGKESNDTKSVKGPLHDNKLVVLTSKPFSTSEVRRVSRKPTARTQPRSLRAVLLRWSCPARPWGSWKHGR
ncbi:unnamed protein product [Ectocarpus sp. 6 AP-2014]